MTLYSKTLLSILCSQTITCKVAFGKTQIMNSVQQIGFAYTVAAADANNIFCKMKFLLEVILKLKNLYRFNKKIQEKALRAKIQGGRIKTNETRHKLVGGSW